MSVQWPYFSIRSLRSPSAPNGAVIGAAGPPSGRLQWESAAGPIHPALPTRVYSSLLWALLFRRIGEWPAGPRARGAGRGGRSGAARPPKDPFFAVSAPPPPPRPGPPRPGGRTSGGGRWVPAFSLGTPHSGRLPRREGDFSGGEGVLGVPGGHWEPPVPPPPPTAPPPPCGLAQRVMLMLSGLA